MRYTLRFLQVGKRDLKVYGQFYIKLSACKIIGNGVTIVGDVSYPIVGVDIVDV